ncbi:hypothetical protein GGS20DRAFT_224291 [Poronia punctata]|nr:hypothetical protein GGS20DRAFT_224291 [Poronia punctata]
MAKTVVGNGGRRLKSQPISCTTVTDIGETGQMLVIRSVQTAYRTDTFYSGLFFPFLLLIFLIFPISISFPSIFSSGVIFGFYLRQGPEKAMKIARHIIHLHIRAGLVFLGIGEQDEIMSHDAPRDVPTGGIFGGGHGLRAGEKDWLVPGLNLSFYTSIIYPSFVNFFLSFCCCSANGNRRYRIFYFVSVRPYHITNLKPTTHRGGLGGCPTRRRYIFIFYLDR